jgi:hypothetical protein
MRKQGSNEAVTGRVCINLRGNKLFSERFLSYWGSDTTLILKCGRIKGSGQETAYLPL